MGLTIPSGNNLSRILSENKDTYKLTKKILWKLKFKNYFIGAVQLDKRV